MAFINVTDLNSSAAIVVSPFVIRELTGDKRVIRLTGRALPYRPLRLKTKQRVEIDWYPGVPEGTATILGPSEDPTQITGKWKDKYLGQTDTKTAPFLLNGEAVLTARAAVNLMDSICRLGQLLEVTWLDTTRQGYLEEFEKIWENEHDVEWNANFTWIGRGERFGAATFGTNNLLGDTKTQLLTQMSRLDTIGTPFRFGLNPGFIDNLRQLRLQIQSAIDSVQSTIQNLTNQVSTTVSATRGVVTVLGGIVTSCSGVVTYLNSQPAGAMNANTDIGSQSFSDKLDAEEFRLELKLWALEMRSIALEQQAALADQIDADVIGRYVARANDDLRHVSTLFYKTPFEWRRIMVFNDLAASELSAGQVVLVPRFNPAEAGQALPGV